jgi:hypothetical protein
MGWNSPANRALSLCSHCCKHNYDGIITWSCSDIITELVAVEAYDRAFKVHVS